MSRSKLLYSETCTEPLLPTGSSSASDELKAMSSQKGALDSSNDVFPVEVESRSFTTEPFHRFGNPASAHHPQAIVSSEDWLTGVVNGNLDPAVTKFGGKERTGINQNSTRFHSNGKRNCRPISCSYLSHTLNNFNDACLWWL